MLDFGVKFRDNDFYFTFISLVEYLNTVEHLKEFNKDQLCEIINIFLYPMYLLHQNKYRYREGSSSTKDYLKVSSNDILIGEELYSFLETTSWENSEFYYSLSGQTGVL